MTTKEEFIQQHNALSSPNLQINMAILDYFKSLKPGLFKDGNYSIEKIRRPFIFWLTSLSDEQKNEINKTSKKPPLTKSKK